MGTSTWTTPSPCRRRNLEAHLQCGRGAPDRLVQRHEVRPGSADGFSRFPRLLVTVLPLERSSPTPNKAVRTPRPSPVATVHHCPQSLCGGCSVSVADVVAQARTALLEIEEAQRDLVAALDRAERGCQLSAQLLLASAHHDVVWTVKAAADAAQPLKQAYAAFGRSADLIRHYLDTIAGGNHSGPVTPPPSPTSVVPPAAPTAPTDAAPLAAPPTVGTWRGKTASEYARNEGEGIGRLSPRGRRTVVREVDSAKEVRDIFDSLSRGARRIDVPGYNGIMTIDSDGTRIGYRYTSATTKDEPTLDVRDADQNVFKVHVATKD